MSESLSRMDNGKAVGFVLRGKTPFCEKCGREVDSSNFEYGLKEVDGPIPRKEHDGSMTVTIRCHGETWSAHRSATGIWTRRDA